MNTDNPIEDLSLRALILRNATKAKHLDLPANLRKIKSDPSAIRLAYGINVIDLPDDDPTAGTVTMHAGSSWLPRGALIRRLTVLEGSLIVGEDRRTSCWLWFQSSANYSGPLSSGQPSFCAKFTVFSCISIFATSSANLSTQV